MKNLSFMDERTIFSCIDKKYIPPHRNVTAVGFPDITLLLFPTVGVKGNFRNRNNVTKEDIFLKKQKQYKSLYN